MSQQWFTASELAGLPGLPKSDRNVRLLAKRHDWRVRKRPQGKGCEYHISTLPEETRAALMLKQAKATAAQSHSEVRAAKQVLAASDEHHPHKQFSKLQQHARFIALPEHKQQVANQRHQLLQELDAFLVPYIAMDRRTAGIKAFVASRNGKPPQATLYRWQQRYRKEGLWGLVDHRGGEGSSCIAQQDSLKQFLVALITAKPHLLSQAKKLHQLARVKADEFGWQLPSVSTLRRWVKQWHSDHRAAFAHVTNPDAYNSRHRPLFGRMYPWLSGPNQVWEFDSTPTDVMLNADGKLKRYALVAAIDVYTRRVKVLVTPTSDSEGICLLLRRCLLDWGMLEADGIARTDNGSDYVSQRVSSIFDLLGIQQSRTRPFSGWEKPYIERFFRTLSSALFELLPAYIGHNIVDRQQIEAAKAFAQRVGGKNRKQNEQESLELALTQAQLQNLIDQWLNSDYEHKVNEGFSGEHKGKTPFEVAATCGFIPGRVPEPHALDMLLNHVGDATVVRGAVQAGSVRYTAPELQESRWDRKRVRVFLDPADVGRASLYPLDDWGTCIEAVNLDLIGREIDPAAFRAARKANQKALASFRKATKQLQAQFGIDTLHAEALAKRAAENGSLIAFPTAEKTSDNPALQGLMAASPATPDSERQRLSTKEEHLAGVKADANRRHSQAMRSEHQHAQALTDASLTRTLTEQETQWLKAYRSKYRLFAKRLDQHLANHKTAQ
ncbi:DNA-binding protein [Ferrimonas balearica]|uniref:DNA-binding protein n=1 Tax=Ferrimonas balearica TaxID=44012 RepID=UPI001C946E71|nr:DNA-binding protein [Ferrimonas balearica]MBY6223595.1 DDE-type integrase/transposase/recombinase [Ferrimonas balearica]